MRHKLITFGLVASLIITGVAFTQIASALSGSDFRAGRIIDDPVFYNRSAMSVTQIQNFLNAKLPTCDTNGTKNYSYHYRSSDGRVNNSNDPWITTTRATYGHRVEVWQDKIGEPSKGSKAPYTCLKSYKQNTPYKAGQSGLCSAINAKTGRSSANIINDVVQACGVSAKVLLVLLDKEQSLVTDDWPWGIQYRSATGYGCPDDAACDSEYYGFFNQIYHAALQYKRYQADPDNWNHIPHMTNQIWYQANAPGCGKKSVYIENQATAGLYNYTPYTPNKAALDNLYGTGDSCSAYGNRNFWRMFNDWFGTTHSIVYSRLQTARWMQTKTDTYKRDPATGGAIDTVIPAGTQIYFPDKTTVNGIMYLRTQHDSDRDSLKGIRYSDLEEIPTNYTSLNEPRWLITNKSLYKIDPVTNQRVQSAIPAGTKIFFATKITVGGQEYLRTQVDTDRNARTGIPYEMLDETTIAIEPFQQPRWMEAERSTAAIRVQDMQRMSEISTGTQNYFSTKFVVNGVIYARDRALDSSQELVGVPLSNLREVSVNFTTMKEPRWMVTKDGAQKTDPRSENSIGSPLRENSEIQFTTKITIGDKTYLRTKRDTEKNIKAGILLSDLEEVAQPFSPLAFTRMKQPRTMELSHDLRMVYPRTGEQMGQLLTQGTELVFDMKTLHNGIWYLRTSDESHRGSSWCIPLSDLQENS